MKASSWINYSIKLIRMESALVLKAALLRWCFWLTNMWVVLGCRARWLIVTYLTILLLTLHYWVFLLIEWTDPGCIISWVILLSLWISDLGRIYDKLRAYDNFHIFKVVTVKSDHLFILNRLVKLSEPWLSRVRQGSVATTWFYCSVFSSSI